ncbi:MAG: hypothetical protein MUE51_13750 [Thermoleophilia bacterium]|nr:hypothetical protein [Thermoleophilia bacterium]
MSHTAPPPRPARSGRTLAAMEAARKHFRDEIDHLRQGLVEMASVVVGQVERAVDAWERRDVAQAAQVVFDDDLVDERCAALDREVFEIQLLEAPVAGDLRLLHVGLITAVALERVGDLATAIARRVRELPGAGDVGEVRSLIQRMGPRAVGALTESVQALARNDVELADQAVENARRVQGMLDQVLMAVSEAPAQGQTDHTWLASAVLVSRHLERVANNAAEIGGRVRFLVTGEMPAELPA